MQMLTVGSGGGGGDARIRKYYGQYHGMNADEVIAAMDQVRKTVRKRAGR